MAGHSLGEYSALFAAGVFDFETGLKIVKKRGELMSQAAGGGMAAVIGLNENKVEEIIREKMLSSISIANYNSPSQIVISGPKADIITAEAYFDSAGARYIPLNVSGAFHSRYMQSARETFENHLDSFAFQEPAIPVISNIQGRPYSQGETKKNLADQITHSVKWTESIRYLMGRGNMTFEEIGPGTVLTRLIQAIQKAA
jgi:trans-AT polyketide synthase/acyltransferase/oxidoreductase domain-containing protein